MHMLSTFVNYYFEMNLSINGLIPPPENYSHIWHIWMSAEWAA